MFGAFGFSGSGLIVWGLGNLVDISLDPSKPSCWVCLFVNSLYKSLKM